MSGACLKSLKWLGRYIPLSRQAAVVRGMLPRSAWYEAALTVSGLHGGVVERIGGNGSFTRAMMLDFWLRELSFGGEFPIPYRVTGLEVCRAPGPKLYTWTHLPLTEVPLRVIVQEGSQVPVVVSDRGKIVDGDKFLVFGWRERIRAIPADGQLVRRVVAELKKGQSVVFLADPFLGGPLSDLPLRLAAKFQVPVVYQWADLAPDRVLDVVFRFAPNPRIEGKVGCEENLAFLRAKNKEALARFGFNGH